MLKKILIGLVLVVLVIILIASFQPTDFRVSRSAVIKAPAQAVFDYVNDMHNWDTWSPWAKLDPNAKENFEGVQAGRGAAFTWSGNNKVGEGRMTITDTTAFELIRMQLDFIRPFKATNTVEFTFKPDGKNTLMTWAMTGKKNFVAKVMGLFMNCDKIIGGSFEKGFSQLNAVINTKK